MPLIKTSALLSTLVLSLTALPAAAADTPPSASDGGAALVLTFEGFKTPGGRILAAVYEGEAAYAGRGSPDQTRSAVLAVQGERATTTLTGSSPAATPYGPFTTWMATGSCRPILSACPPSRSPSPTTPRA